MLHYLLHHRLKVNSNNALLATGYIDDYHRHLVPLLAGNVSLRIYEFKIGLELRLCNKGKGELLFSRFEGNPPILLA